MKTKRIVIVGNGVLDKEILTYILNTDYCIGVDFAAYWLIRHGRVPDVAIGDFDSVTPDQLKEIRKRVPDIITFAPEKDFTDMELAVRHALRKDPQEIILLGALGKRLDQSLANIGLLEAIEANGTHGFIYEAKNKATLVSKNLILKDGDSYISVLSVTPEAVITLKGFKYSISEKVIRRGQTIGISNELAGKEASVHVKKGKVLVVISTD